VIDIVRIVGIEVDIVGVVVGIVTVGTDVDIVGKVVVGIVGR
jgi:hypothetical protein